MNKITTALGFSGIIAVGSVLVYAMLLNAVQPIGIPDARTWIYLAFFFSVLGASFWIIKLVSNNLIDTFRENPAHELDGVLTKWKYVFTLTAQISIGIFFPLSLGFFISYSQRNSIASTLPIQYVLLMLIVVVGSFVFSWETWKLKERRSKKR